MHTSQGNFGCNDKYIGDETLLCQGLTGELTYYWSNGERPSFGEQKH